MELVNTISHNSSKTIQGFGINVDNKFIDVTARQLDPPQIQYKNSKLVKPKNGVWNMLDSEFLITDSPPGGFKWGILNIEGSTNPYAIKKLNDMVS